ncbi:MAG TPA: DUF1127 domain-containing protein [Methylomirabilota bacterium]|nr:DUF1127 domain-containing protein [Methylomirabilota bacterium]
MTEIRTIETRMDVTALTAGAIARVVATSVREIGARIRRAYVARRDAEALRHLNDAALKDIGIDRGRIDHAVRFGRGSEQPY